MASIFPASTSQWSDSVSPLVDRKSKAAFKNILELLREYVSLAGVYHD